MKQPELGKKILELRLMRGLTQSELAEQCNLSLRTIQRIESHEVTPRSHTIRVIFSNLNYDPEDLFATINPEGSNHGPKPERKRGQVFRELFDLKTNTVMKLSVLSLIIAMSAASIFVTNNDLKAQKLEGWFKTGSKPESYDIGLDSAVYKSGSGSAFLFSNEKKIKGFGTIMQTCSAEEFLGKRVKMKGYVRSEAVDQWAGMWFRVDGKARKVLGFDNMQDRPIKGDNDWKLCEIILDVPEESLSMNYGVLLSGPGKVWFDNISFEIVDKADQQPTSEVSNRSFHSKPTNLDFGE